jgi:plasmid stabilization system protein ParE
MKVGFHPAADLEFRAAAAYYDKRALGLGAEFIADLERQCALLAERATIGRRYDAVHRLVLLRRFPFALIYRTSESEVTIIAVAHTRRRPGYWRGRS